MEKKIGYLALMAMMFLSPPLLALTDAEVEARLNQYEAQIKALEADLANAKKTPVYEQDVGKSSSKIEKQVQQIKDKMDADSQQFKVNGFMTAAVAVADDPLGTDYQFDDKPNFSGDSKVGLQFTGNMDDKTSATVQLLARSRGRGAYSQTDAWNVAAEWAYLAYKATDDLTLRMGKLRVPFYMYSETLDVGYSYPWVRPPTDMYITIFSSYSGADLLYKFSLGSVNNSLQFFGGSSKGATPTPAQDLQYPVTSSISSDIALEDMYGINLTSTWGDFTARLMATTMRLQGSTTTTFSNSISNLTANSIQPNPLAPNFVPGLDALGGTCVAMDLTNPLNCNQWTLSSSVDDTLNYFSAGFQYDNGSAFVIAEAAHLDTLNGSLFGNGDQHYITAGYRFGSWTPYATYGHSYDTELSLIPGSVQHAMKSRSIGLRKEVSSSMSAKVELNNFYDLENNGGFSRTASIGDDANILTFALDAVF